MKIKINDFYADTKDDVESRFGMSGNDQDHSAAAAPKQEGVGFKVSRNKIMLGMMKDETTGTEISEFAGLQANCYAHRVVRKAEELKKLNIDDKTFTEPLSYTKQAYKHSTLITSITKTINSVSRSFVRDSGSGVVSEEIKKDKGVKKGVVAKGLMLEDFKRCYSQEILSIER
jgi:hypothetical protein